MTRCCVEKKKEKKSAREKKEEKRKEKNEPWEEHLFTEDHDLLVSFEDEIDERVVVAILFSNNHKRDAGVIEDVLVV